MHSMTVSIADQLNALFLTPRTEGFASVGAAASIATARGPNDENQDRAFVAILSRRSGGNLLLAAVLDGSGVRRPGWAASIAAASFIQAVAGGVHDNLAKCLDEAARSANMTVWSRLRGTGGTALTALALTDGGECRAVHVGDSRLYRVSRGPQQITTDDTPGVWNDDRMDSRLRQFVGIGEGMSHQAFDLSTDPSEMLLLTTRGLDPMADWSCVERAGAEPSATVKSLMGSAAAATVVAVNRRLALVELGRFTGGLEVISTTSHATLAWCR